jgi:TolA-binding protein
MLPFNPIMGYVAGGALLIGVAAGWTVKDWQCDAAYAKAVEKAEKQRQQMQGKIDEVSSLYQTQRDQTDVVVAGERETIREIYKTIPASPVDCVPDARVVGLLEGGVNRANAAATSEPSK